MTFENIIKKYIAIAALIRKAINNFLKTKTKQVNWNNDSLTKIIGKVELSVNDASEEHDNYLYGKSNI